MLTLDAFDPFPMHHIAFKVIKIIYWATQLPVLCKSERGSRHAYVLY